MDILPMIKKSSYTGSLKNGVQSERYLLLVCSSDLLFSDCTVSQAGQSERVRDALAGLKQQHVDGPHANL